MRRDTPALEAANLAAAFTYASRLHADQTRRTGPDPETPGVPYIAHLMGVTALVLEHGGSETEAVAALLHDGPEDQGGRETLGQIRRLFGVEVARIVEGCSDTLEQPKPLWYPRKRGYIRHLEADDHEPTVFVSLADKVHNSGAILADHRRIGAAVWQRFNRGRDGTLWYYHRLLAVFAGKAMPRCEPLVRRLSETLAELDRRVAGTEGADVGAIVEGFPSAEERRIADLEG